MKTASTVYLASAFGVSRTYTSRKFSEQALCLAIKDRFLSYAKERKTEFLCAFAREDYLGAIQIYNSCIIEHRNCSLYLATIVPCELNMKFI
jgi:hypothetical protein